MPTTTVQEVLVARLIATPGVTAFVGALKPRIFPLLLPQNADLPAITYFTVNDDLNLTMGLADPFDHPRIQFSCWSRYYIEAKRLAQAVRASLHGLVDPATTPKIVQVVTVNEGPDLYEPDVGYYHVPVDFSVWTQG